MTSAQGDMPPRRDLMGEWHLWLSPLEKCILGQSSLKSPFQEQELGVSELDLTGSHASFPHLCWGFYPLHISSRVWYLI